MRQISPRKALAAMFLTMASALGANNQAPAGQTDPAEPVYPVRSVNLNVNTLILECDEKGRAHIKFSFKNSADRKNLKVYQDHFYDFLNRKYKQTGPYNTTMARNDNVDNAMVVTTHGIETWADLTPVGAKSFNLLSFVRSQSAFWASRQGFDFIDRTPGSTTLDYEAVDGPAEPVSGMFGAEPETP